MTTKPTKTQTTRGSRKVTKLTYKAAPKRTSVKRGRLEIKTFRRGNVTTVEYVSPAEKKKTAARKPAAPKAKKACVAKKNTVTAPVAPIATGRTRRVIKKRYKYTYSEGHNVRTKIKNWKDEALNQPYFNLPPIPYKKRKFNIYEFTIKDELRPVFSGVYHDGSNKCAVATTAHILIKTKALYNAKYKGKIINKFGGEIGYKFPNYEAVFQKEKYAYSFSVQKLANHLQAIKEHYDNLRKTTLAKKQAEYMYKKATMKKDDIYCCIRLGHTTGLFSFSNLEKCVNAAVNFDIKNGYFNNGATQKTGIIFENNDTKILLMPKNFDLFEKNEEYSDQGYNNVYYLIEL